MSFVIVGFCVELYAGKCDFERLNSIVRVTSHFLFSGEVGRDVVGSPGSVGVVVVVTGTRTGSSSIVLEDTLVVSVRTTVRLVLLCAVSFK